ncbi:MAG TPA: AAA family ATPase [Mycobacterium sp.]|nr:AAA family ATPase [Mycobacterium sp.]
MRAVADVLRRAVDGPAGLAITGEAGIGKTTVWLDVVDHARREGFRVSSARAAEAESVLAYAAVADLVDGLLDGGDSAVLDALPTFQRIAIDRVLLSAAGDGPMTDQRTAAAAFTAIVEALAVEQPVLLAIDDVQWLDSSSRTVIAFAARRFKGRVAVLCTERTEGRGSDASSWLRMSRLDGVASVGLGPLSPGVLHALLSDRLGRALPRPTMTLGCTGGGGVNSILGALTVQTGVAAYTGDEPVARQTSTRAVVLAARCGARRTAEVTTMMLAFLEASLGRHAEALRVLDALIAKFPSAPTGTEIISAMFIPEAVESLVTLGRAGEAEPMTAALEANGARLNRPWMLAVGARCRAMMLAAGGDLVSAERVLRHAGRARPVADAVREGSYSTGARADSATQEAEAGSNGDARRGALGIRGARYAAVGSQGARRSRSHASRARRGVRPDTRRATGGRASGGRVVQSGDRR